MPGEDGRSLAAVDSFPYALRSRAPIRNHRKSATTVILAKASASSDGTSIKRGTVTGKRPRTGPEFIIGEVTQSSPSQSEGDAERSERRGCPEGTEAHT